MHSYRQDIDSWVVYFAIGSRVDFILKTFDREEDAAAYASYLNGGSHPDVAR